MNPTAAARRTAHSIWFMARLSNHNDTWRWAHDCLFAVTLYAGAQGNFVDEGYFNELAEAASEIAADCR